MHKRLIALDWNGTLFDDLHASCTAANVFLAAVGASNVDLATYQDEFEIPVVNFIRKRGGDVALFEREGERLINEFRAAVEESRHLQHLREGVPEFLEWAAAKNLHAVILSNHPVIKIVDELEKRDLKKHFDEKRVLGTQLAREVVHARGKGQKLADYMASENFMAANVIVVGDTVEEAEIARETGAASALLTGGFNSESRLRAAEPTFLLHTLSDLQDALIRHWDLG